MKTMLLRLSILIIALFAACADLGVEPDPVCYIGELDSTSHAFSWTITELGDGGGSILYDVAIVNDTLVYAVGEIYLRDSTGQFEQPYNIAKWNGQGWMLFRIPYQLYNFDCTVAGTYFGDTRAIFAFDASNIVLTDGVDVVRWDGSSYSRFPCLLTALTGGINKLWGRSTNDFFAVGTNGAIVKYSNGAWQKLSSGTSLPIRDIWGSTDSAGEQMILAIASGSSPEEGKKLLSVKGTTVTHLADEGLSWSLNGVWFVPNCRYYIVGAGIHQKSALKDAAWSVYSSGEVTSYLSGGVRGSALNNVFVVGSFFEVVHFNGSTWYNYRNEIQSTGGALGGVAAKDNLVVAVGLNGQKAVAVIGKR